VHFGEVPLEQVAFTERLFPSEWIDDSGTGVLEPYRAFIGPLVGPVESLGHLLPVAPHRTVLTGI
jgi:hypothetical protein